MNEVLPSAKGKVQQLGEHPDLGLVSQDEPMKVES